MADKAKVTAIVQARTSSSRLPGKVLKEILGKPMIILELERLRHCQTVDEIILATSSDDSDKELANIVRNNDFPVYQGSLNDVLDRYYQCAKRCNPTHVVRITGDCPIIDPQIVDTVIFKHLQENYDYTSNILGKITFPDGLDTEVMRFSALERAWKEAKLPSEREHVTQYIIKHPEIFKQGALLCETPELGDERWTVDEPEDFRFISEVYERLYPDKPDFTLNDVLALLAEHPELRNINRGFERNEGLLKSLREDKIKKEANVKHHG